MDHTRQVEETRVVIEQADATSAHLFQWAAIQLDAIELAVDLYRRLREPGGRDLLEHLGGRPQATGVLCIGSVIRTGMTVLDLCAAVMYRLSEADGIAEGMEADLEWWGGKEGKPQRRLLPPKMNEWITSVRERHEWDQLKTLRDNYTHKQVRIHAIIEAPPAVMRFRFPGANDELEDQEHAAQPGLEGLGASLLQVGDERIDALDLLPRLYKFVRDQFFAFAEAANAAYGHQQG